MNEPFGPMGPMDTTWGMFTLTGNPAYYMLYANLNDENGEHMTQEERERR